MAISYIGAGAVQTGTNPTVPVPAGYAAGDFLIIFATSGTSASVPSGWTNIQSVTSQVLCCYKVATASESSVAMTIGGTSSDAVMLCYRGVGSLDTVSTVSNTPSGTSVATNTLTTTATNDYVVSYFTASATASTWTAPGSTTTRINQSSTLSLRGMLIVDELQVSAGTSTSRTATTTVGLSLYAVAFSLKEPTATSSGNFFRMF